MPFANYKNWDACINAQMKKGRSKKSAEKICGYLKHKTEGSKIESDDFDDWIRTQLNLDEDFNDNQ